MSGVRGEDGRVQFRRKGEYVPSGRACTRPSQSGDAAPVSYHSRQAGGNPTNVHLTAEQQAEVAARVAVIAARVEKDLKRLGLKRGAREEEIALTSVERTMEKRKQRAGQ